jgi:DNA-directed RNA polymerase sigma subunit (sigma70/sigma32)
MSEMHKSIKKKKEKKIDELSADIEAPLSLDTNINEDKESMIFLS